jgi:UDP-glucose:(heptosyl)LPS alpha-1,3-glucosyltransferase
VAHGRTRKIYNAIPDKAFQAPSDASTVRDELKIPRTARVFLFVGRLAARKGLDTLLEAVAPILSGGGHYLLLSGVPDLSVPGTAELMAQINAFMAKKGLSDYIKFLGFRRDVSRLMASADLMIHPARIEAFGLVLVEALATGLPLVATCVDGIPEVLADTDVPMVEPGDPGALRAAILAVLDRSVADVARARQKGLERANQFRLSKRTDAMLTLYRDVMADKL